LQHRDRLSARVLVLRRKFERTRKYASCLFLASSDDLVDRAAGRSGLTGGDAQA
jgi:hypothetical protein